MIVSACFYLLIEVSFPREPFQVLHLTSFFVSFREETHIMSREMMSQIVKPWEELKKIEKEKGGKDDEDNRRNCYYVSGDPIMADNYIKVRGYRKN